MIKNYYYSILSLFVFCGMYSQHEIWGTVAAGGENNYGYIYKCNATGDNFTIVHHFQGTDGYSPGALLAASNNKLYGVTTSGGNAGTSTESIFSGGVLFEIDLATDTFTVLKHFMADNPEITGVKPMGTGQLSLTEASPGIIYGNIRSGLSDRIFAYNIQENTITSAAMMPTFNGGFSNTPQGMRLTGALYPAADGYLYGSTMERSQCPIGMPYGGTIVRMDPVTNVITLPYIAPCGDFEQGRIYRSNFVAHGNELYSITTEGGAYNKGVIYSYNTATGIYTKRYDFDGAAMGWEPNTLVKAPDGKLYGTTLAGGLVQPNMPFGCGILYEYDPVGNVFTKLYDFPFENGWYMAVGAYPTGPMVQGGNGKLYGVTRNGVYEFDPETGAVTARGRFSIDYPGDNGYATVTAVCRKPVYSQSATTLQGCPGEQFSFDIESLNSETVVWYHNDAADASQTGTVLAFDALMPENGGEWRAELANECGTTTTHTITIAIAETPEILQDSASLYTSMAATAYQWNDCGTGNAIEGATGAVLTPSESGSYSVTLTTGSCSVTSGCFEYSILSNNTPVQNTFTLFPNPARSTLTVEAGNTLQDGTIINLLGQKVLDITTGSNDISGLPAGVYLVAFAAQDRLVTQKFVKE